MLKFSAANAKLVELERLTGKKVYSISKLSGFSCCGANECLAFAVRKNGKTKLVEGKEAKFRCFSASQEALFPVVYNQRKHNLDALKACNNKEEIVQLIEQSLPKGDNYIVRISVAGDFISQDEFDAWCEIACKHKNKHFYAYTKSIPFWIARLGQIPKNFILTASLGSKFDEDIMKHKLRHVLVVRSKLEAKLKKLPIDHDDRFACLPQHKNKNFALLIHAIQPAKSSFARAKTRLAKDGYTGYSK